MKIWCTVLRENGTYHTQPIKAGKKEFTLDKCKYNITGFYHGRLLGIIPVLRAVYIEGNPDMLEIDWETYKKDNKIKMKIDARGLKILTDKKILSAFDEMEFTKIEQLLIIAVIGSLAIGVLNLTFLFQIIDKLGGF